MNKLDLPHGSTTKFSSSSKNSQSDLNELIILLSNRLALSKNLLPSPSSTKLCENTSQWQSLDALSPEIGNLMSSYFQAQALALYRIVNPNSDITSNPHPLIMDLVPSTQARQLDIEKKRYKLDLRRVELVGKVNMLLSLYHLASTLVILHLEQTVHGSISRELKLRSVLASLNAQKLEYEAKEKRLKGEKIFYSDDVIYALKEYMRSLHKGRESLEERKSLAENKLSSYRECGTERRDAAKVMRSIADKYAELRKELDGVRRDIEKLKGRPLDRD